MRDYTRICCPQCKGKLDLNEGLYCPKCDITYDIVGGIPVMIPQTENGDGEQERSVEKKFYEEMFSDLKGFDDGHCVLYGYERVQEFMEGIETGNLIEAGCGGGHHSVNLARRGFRVTSVDLSMNGLMAAKRLAEHEGQDVAFVCGDIKKLPFEDREFDVCFCSLILHHFTALNNVVRELARVTKKSFVAFEVNAHEPITWTRFNVINPLVGIKNISKNQRALFPHTLSRELRNNGFETVAVSYEDVHDYLGKEPESFRSRMISAYQKTMRVFPKKYSHNKFLLLARRD